MLYNLFLHKFFNLKKMVKFDQSILMRNSLIIIDILF